MARYGRERFFFENEKFCSLLKSKSSKVIELLLPTFYRDGHLHWNPTVNKMTATVLNQFKSWDCNSFEKVAKEMFSTSVSRDMIDSAVNKWRRDESDASTTNRNYDKYNHL